METEADNLRHSARRHAGVDGERKFGEIEFWKCGKTISHLSIQQYSIEG
jgi:hypothetical protein